MLVPTGLWITCIKIGSLEFAENDTKCLKGCSANSECVHCPDRNNI